MPMNTNVNPINTDVTVTIVVSNGFGPSKSRATPGGGVTDGSLLSWAGSSCANWANWSAMLRLDGGVSITSSNSQRSEIHSRRYIK